MCMMAGTNEEDIEGLGNTLLEGFHDVCRYNTEAANDMVADFCYCPNLCFEKQDEEGLQIIRYFGRNMAWFLKLKENGEKFCSLNRKKPEYQRII